jgi:hypothetical protein
MIDAVAVALARALPQMASLMTLKLSSIARLHSRRLIVSLARLGFCTSSFVARLSSRPVPPRITAFLCKDFVALLAGLRSADLAIAELCGAVAKLPSLRTLDLRGHALCEGYAKAVALAGALPKMASLMTLHLIGTSSLSFELPCVGVSMPRPIRG